MVKIFLSIVIPVKNNAKTLPLMLIDADYHLSKEDWPYEILLIDDASEDASPEIIRKFLPLIKNIRALFYSSPQGTGACLALGLKAAKGEYVVVMPSDNSISIEEFHKALPYLKNGYSLALGSRASLYSHTVPDLQFFPHLFRVLHNLVAQIIVAPTVWDADSGFMMMPHASAERLSGLLKIKGYGATIEIAALALRLGYRIKEFPITWIRRGKFKYSRSISALKDALLVRWMLLKREYKFK